MHSEKFVKLIFENLQFFVKVANFIEGEFSERLYEAIEEITLEIIGTHANIEWKVCVWDVYHGYDYKELRMAPEIWCTEQDLQSVRPDSCYASFNLCVSSIEYLKDKDCQFGNNKNCFPVSQFFKNIQGDMLFKFIPDFRIFSTLYGQGSIRFSEENQSYRPILEGIWSSYWQQQAEKYSMLEQYGFQFHMQNSYWYLVLEKLDPAWVAECYSKGLLKDALDPVKEALDKIKAAYLIFNNIVEEAKQDLI